MFESMFVSALSVVLAEMGDKTQLLAFLLAARFHRSVPIVLGIFVATLLNHGFAGALGAWITTVLGPTTLKVLLVGGFWTVAVWMLIPDKEDGGLLDNPALQRFGVFGITLVTFFLAEMGDKTQMATVGLAAHYGNAPRCCLRNYTRHAHCRRTGGLFRRYSCQKASDSADSHCLCRPVFCTRCRGAHGLTTEPFLFPRPHARSA